MMRKLKIAPSILAADFVRLHQEIADVESNLDWLHIDIMDGQFVPVVTFGQQMISCLRKNFPDMFLDVHLMVKDPLLWIELLKPMKVNQITFHIESVDCDLDASRHICKLLRKIGVRASVTLKPKTPLSAVAHLIRENLVDNVLVMTVEPGYGGQKFMVDMIDKIRELRSMKSDIDVQVDGGIDISTIGLCASAGANAFVAGSAIFGNKENRKGIIQNLREVAERST